MRTPSRFQVSLCYNSYLLAASKSCVATIDLDTSSSHTQPPPWEFDDQDRSKLCSVLFGKDSESGFLSKYITEFSVILWARFLKYGVNVKDVIRHIECLVALLESDGGPTLNNLYEAGRCLEGWPKASTLENHVSAIFYTP